MHVSETRVSSVVDGEWETEHNNNAALLRSGNDEMSEWTGYTHFVPFILNLMKCLGTLESYSAIVQ